MAPRRRTPPARRTERKEPAMRLRNSIGIAAVIAGTAFATASVAQSAGDTTRAPGDFPPPRTGATWPTGSPQNFSALDKNQDGYVSRMEAAEGGLTRSFTDLDKNNDGRLDSAEFAAQSERPASAERQPNAAAPVGQARR
jgi:hypothetical protein